MPNDLELLCLETSANKNFICGIGGQELLAPLLYGVELLDD